MKKYLLIAVTSIFLFSNCATIVGHTRYPVVIDSNPRGASVEIADENGVVVFSGNTPATAVLKTGKYYFGKKNYTATFKSGDATQTQQIYTSLNGWYWANILIGGVIGLLIVDPLTGAMYEISNQNVLASLPVTATNVQQMTGK